MDHYPLKPENMKAPAHLTREEIQLSLDELDSKIKVLKGRANATAADSNHTYHEHIAGLEKKRELIASKMADAKEDQSSWHELREGLESLKKEITSLFK
ncbi:sll1863 family stress response protein [Pontibacter sp. CAU 1760]